MKRLIEFSLKETDTTTVVVEVDEPEMGGTVRAARPGERLEHAKKTIEASLSEVLPAVEQITDKLRSMNGEPEEFEVAFGIKLSPTFGAFIASNGNEANFNVRVIWNKGAKWCIRQERAADKGCSSGLFPALEANKPGTLLADAPLSIAIPNNEVL